MTYAIGDHNLNRPYYCQHVTPSVFIGNGYDLLRSRSRAFLTTAFSLKNRTKEKKKKKNLPPTLKESEDTKSKNKKKKSPE
jgi:hypothetical protein